MKNKILSIVILLCFSFGKINAQAAPLSGILAEGDPFNLQISFNSIFDDMFLLSNYHFQNPFYFNPAMAGIDEKKRINLDWNRLYDHHFHASYEQPISSINSNIGMDAMYTSDFFFSIMNYGATYNYGVKIKKHTQIRFGFKFSQFNYKRNNSQVDKKWKSFPIADLGFALKRKQFKIGLSWQNAFPKKLPPFTILGSTFELSSMRQFNFSIANTIKVSKNVDWTLAALFRDNKDEGVNDISTFFLFEKKYTVGLTVRSGNVIDYNWIGYLGLRIRERCNLNFSYNLAKDTNDPRFFEVLTQYEF